MSIEMSGIDTKDNEYEITPLKVGEVKSSIPGERVDIIDPTQLVLQAARRGCTPDVKIYNNAPELKTDPVKAAQHIGYDASSLPLPDEFQNFVAKTLIEAAAKVQTASDNLNLTPKQKEHFDGVKTNYLGAIPFYSGPAAQVLERVKDDSRHEANKLTGKIVKSAAEGLLVLQMATGCNINAKPIEITPTTSPIVETTQDIIPIGASTETPVATEQIEPTEESRSRLPVTAEDVKNLSEPSRLMMENGELVGFPEGTSQDIKDAAKPFFDAASSKFILSKIFFTQDPESGQIALYAISPEGKLFFSTVEYGGPAQYSDYPISYESKNHTWNVDGSYVSIEIPDGTLNTIWKNGYLQFVGGKKEATDGNTYYTEYMVNQTLASESPWSKIPGVGDLVGDPEIKDALDVSNYKIVDGNIEENKGGSWQEVSVPYEAGYIAYVEIHDGKAYGIDTADRAVVVRNADTGEWEKFDRPIFGDDFDNFQQNADFEDGTYNKITYKLLDKNFNAEEIEVKNITKLKASDGTSIDWGYIKGSYNWKDLVSSELSPLPKILTRSYEFQASGYFIGKVTMESHAVTSWTNQPDTVYNGKTTMYVYEIPYKYSRQILLVNIPNTSNNFYRVAFSNIYNTNITNIHNYPSVDFTNLIESNMDILYGRQVILDLKVDTIYENGISNWKAISTYKASNLNSPMTAGGNIFTLLSDNIK